MEMGSLFSYKKKTRAIFVSMKIIQFAYHHCCLSPLNRRKFWSIALAMNGKINREEGDLINAKWLTREKQAKWNLWNIICHWEKQQQRKREKKIEKIAFLSWTIGGIEIESSTVIKTQWCSSFFLYTMFFSSSQIYPLLMKWLRKKREGRKTSISTVSWKFFSH